MEQLLNYSVTLASVVGAALCAIAGVGRMAGYHYLGGFEVMTIFSAGTALMVFGCLMKLDLVLFRRKSPQ